MDGVTNPIKRRMAMLPLIGKSVLILSFVCRRRPADRRTPGTAPTFVMPNAEEREAQMVEDLGRARRHAQPGEASFLGVRFLRLPDDRAGVLVAEFISRLEALARETQP